MPKAAARLATSRPMRPRPTRPSVFPASSTPMNFERSQPPACMLASAAATLRAVARSRAQVCSQAEMVFAAGALMTAMPRREAPGTSMLSTPTPARPMRRRALAFSSQASVTLVSERTSQTCAPGTHSAILAASPTAMRSSTPESSASGFKPAGSILSVTRTRRRPFLALIRRAWGPASWPGT